MTVIRGYRSVAWRSIRDDSSSPDLTVDRLRARAYLGDLSRARTAMRPTDAIRRPPRPWTWPPAGKLVSPALLAAHYRLGRQRPVGETRVAVYAADDPAGSARRCRSSPTTRRC